MGVGGGTGYSSSGDFCGRGDSSSDDKRGGARSRFVIRISGKVRLRNGGSDPNDVDDGENIGQGPAVSCCDVGRGEKELSGGTGGGGRGG